MTRSRCSGTSPLALRLQGSRGSASKMRFIHAFPQHPRVEVTRLLRLERHRNAIKAVTRLDLHPSSVSRDASSAFCTVVCAVSTSSLHPSVSHPSSQSGTACSDHEQTHVSDTLGPLWEPSNTRIIQSLAKIPNYNKHSSFYGEL